MSRGTGRERGVALVAVLWFVVAASGLALTFVKNGQADLIQARGQLDGVQAGALVEAGVARAVAELARVAERGTPPSRVEAELGGGRVDVRLEREAGKIDLNKASGELVGALARVLELPPGVAGGLGDKVVDWRDEDDRREPNGAELADYRAAGRPWRPANGPFRHVDELRFLPGVDATAYATLAPYLTVYSGLEQPDPEFAAAAVRDASQLGGTRSRRPGEDEGTGGAGGADEAGASAGGDGEGGPGRDAAPDEEAGGGGGEGDGPQDGRQVFSLWLKATLGNGYVRAAHVVVLLNRTSGAPYRVLDWAPVTVAAVEGA